jgi:hypothetical protein
LKAILDPVVIITEARSQEIAKVVIDLPVM